MTTNEQANSRLQRPAAAGALTAAPRGALPSNAAAAEPPSRWAVRRIAVRYMILILASALCATGCIMPHVERTHAAVHGVVMNGGAAAPGVMVIRCVRGCNDTEHVVSDVNGVFDLPAHHALGLFILPVPFDPIKERGFDLQANNVVYSGIRQGGIGRPPVRYTVTCDLAGAVPRGSEALPGSEAAEPICKILHVDE